MHKLQIQVAEFMAMARQPMPKETTIPLPDIVKARVRLLREELEELIEGLHSDDISEILDGLCDLLYVTYGTANAYGLDLEDPCDVIHLNNLLKRWSKEELIHMPAGSVAHSYSPTSYVVLLDGKLIKPPTHVRPELSPYLYRPFNPFNPFTA